MCKKQELLKGLQGEGISLCVRNLAKYMAGTGVLVEPHIGRQRGYIPLSEKTWGFNPASLSDEGKAFFSAQVKSGHLNFIPAKDEKGLGTLEQNLRRAVQARTLADGFVPVAAYSSLKEEFEKIRTQYLEKRDDICSRWPLMMAEFKAGVQSMLAGVEMDETEKEKLLQQFMKAVPNVERYRNSFSMSLKVQAFPADVAVDGLDADVQADVKESWREDVVDTAIASITSTIQNIWDRCLVAMGQYLAKNSINTKTLDALNRDAESLSWRNVFSNTHLAELSNILLGIREKDVDAQAEAIEAAVVKTYTYSKLARFDLPMDNSPYTVETLESMERMVA